MSIIDFDGPPSWSLDASETEESQEPITKTPVGGGGGGHGGQKKIGRL